MSVLNIFPLSLSLRAKLYKFTRNQQGITAIEYATLALGLTALLVALTQSGGTVDGIFKDAFARVSTMLGEAGSGS